MSTITYDDDKLISFTQLGLEDLFWGDGSQTVVRFGEEYIITDINAGNMPFDASRTLQEVLDDQYPSVEIVGADIASVVTVATDMPSVLDVSTDPLRQAILDGGGNAEQSQLEAWNAMASQLTADSYATEPEDVFVKEYASNDDGTYTATDTTFFSALHWSIKLGVGITITDHTQLTSIGTNTHAELDNHLSSIVNPHSVTAIQAGAEVDLGTPSIDGQVLTSLQDGTRSWKTSTTGVTDHLLLSNIGTNTHVQIDEHLADEANPHAVTTTQIGAEDALGNPDVDDKILSSTVSGVRTWITPPSGVTDHALLSNIGTNTHVQIDAHVVSKSNPHEVSALQIGAAAVDHNHNGEYLPVADPTFTGTLEGPTVSSPAHVVGDYTMQDGGLGAFNIRNNVFGSNKLHIWGADVPTLTLEEINLTWGGKPLAIAEDVLPVTNPTFLGTMTGPLYVTGTYAFRDHGLGVGSIYMVGGTDYVSWGDNSLELSLGTENLLWASNQVMVSDVTQDTGAKLIENMVEITQAAYDAITPVDGTVYFIVG